MKSTEQEGEIVKNSSDLNRYIYENKLSDEAIYEKAQRTIKRLILDHGLTQFQATVRTWAYYYMEPEDFDEFTEVALSEMVKQANQLFGDWI